MQARFNSDLRRNYTDQDVDVSELLQGMALEKTGLTAVLSEDVPVAIDPVGERLGDILDFDATNVITIGVDRVENYGPGPNMAEMDYDGKARVFQYTPSESGEQWAIVVMPVDTKQSYHGRNATLLYLPEASSDCAPPITRDMLELRAGNTYLKRDSNSETWTLHSPTEVVVFR